MDVSGITASLCIGQVHGLGGDERLARAIVGTRLRDRFEHDEF